MELFRQVVTLLGDGEKTVTKCVDSVKMALIVTNLQVHVLRDVPPDIEQPNALWVSLAYVLQSRDQFLRPYFGNEIYAWNENQVTQNLILTYLYIFSR